MTEAEFENRVAKALDELPDSVRQKLDNVAVTAARKPTLEQEDEEGTRRGSLLLGLYEGIPETEYGKGFGDNLPDKITIFQDSIETLAHSPQEVEQLVYETLWHEIAHHFGYDDDELEEMEKRKGFLS